MQPCQERENRNALGCLIRKQRDYLQLDRNKVAEKLRILTNSDFDYVSFLIAVEHGTRIFYEEDRKILLRLISILDFSAKTHSRALQLIGQLCPQKMSKPRLTINFQILRNKSLQLAHLYRP